MNHQKVQSWTSIFLAFTAIAGLGLAFYQNQKTVELADAASNSFKASVFPLLRFSVYKWIHPPGNLSCERPATGINVMVENASTVPIIIESSSYDLTANGKSLDDDLPDDKNLVMGGEQETIIASRDSTAFTGFYTSLPEIYSSMKGYNENSDLRLEIKLRYRSLITQKRYCYSATIGITEDCRLPNQRNYIRLGDTVALCSDLEADD